MQLCVAPVKEIRPKLASFCNWSRDDSGGRGSEHKLYRMWNHKVDAITRMRIKMYLEKPFWILFVVHRVIEIFWTTTEEVSSLSIRETPPNRPIGGGSNEGVLKCKKSSSKFQGTENIEYLQAYSWWECWQCSWTCKGEIRTPIKSSSNAPYTSSFEKSKATLHDEDHDADDNEEECV